MMQQVRIWAALAFVFAFMALTQFNPLVVPAQNTNAKIALAAGGTYVSLRFINAALSTAQEVEVSASLGVGGSAQPLKVLEPVDDTVERAADVVFVIALMTGTLAVGLGPVAAIGSGFAAMACAARAAGWRHAIWSRMLSLGLVAALALPGAFWVGGGLATLMTRDAQTQAQATLDDISGEAQALFRGDADPETAPVTVVEDDRWALTRWFEGATDSVTTVGEAFGRYAGSVEYFLQNAEALFQALLVLMGAFILQSLALPIILLGFVWGVLRR